MTYDVGSNNHRVKLVNKKKITWFVESWSWYVVLSTSGTGTATFGSKAGLITVLQTVSPLRLVVHEAADSYSIIEADNIAIENSEVAAQSIRYISDENGSAGIQRRFKSPVYKRFTLTSTDGNQWAGRSRNTRHFLQQYGTAQWTR